MTNRAWTFAGRAAALLVVLVALLPALVPAAAHAAEPVIVYQNLNDGDELSAAPYVVQLCFAEPLNASAFQDGGDFAFTMRSDSGQADALTIVFQPDGYGVSVYPIDAAQPSAEQPTAGSAWTFHYRVADSEDGTPLEGDIHFTVKSVADAIPRATPPACTSAGGVALARLLAQDQTDTDTPRPTRTPRVTAEPTAVPTAAPTGETGSPGASESPGASGSATSTPAATSEDDNGGTDVLPIVLVAIGAIGLIGGAGAIAYLARKRRTPGAPTS